jgi:DNA-directed RNA polymerase specialized sigma24 family protein
MAATVAAAFEELGDKKLDLFASSAPSRFEPLPTDDAVVAAFTGIDRRLFERVTLKLGRRCRRHLHDAEEAVQDALLELYVSRRELFHENPENWLGLLYTVARFRLLQIGGVTKRRVASLEAMNERGGDSRVETARPCIPLSSDAEEDRMYELPSPGETWNRAQMISAAQRFRDYYGRPPNLRDCKPENRLPSPAPIYRVFQSFDQLILAAGMTPERIGVRRVRWSASEAAETCKSFKHRHGYWPSWSDIKRYPGELPNTGTMVRFFGGTRSIDVQIGVEAILDSR